MKHYVSLLRGINVGGHKKIKMAELRELYESVGFTAVKTYLQSGNVVFAAEESDRLSIARELESAIKAHYGYEVSVLIRDLTDLEAVIAGNAFPSKSNEDPTKMCVIFLAHTPSSESLAA